MIADRALDDGTAPCVDRSFLSMTVCKPKVHTSAKVGDIFIAFGTNAQPTPAASFSIAIAWTFTATGS